MTDFFAQFLQTFQERMRTPWIGSILIAFLLWNWQPLFFLVASDTALLTRFAYFEIHTDWCSLFFGPLIAGFVFAALKLWISLVMDWLGAKAIHQSRLHADRLAADRHSKQLEQQKNLAKEEHQNKKEIIGHAIERNKIIDAAPLDEDEKEQLQQELRVLQLTPQKEDSGPVDEGTRASAALNLLDEDARKILCGLARRESGVAQFIDHTNGSFELIDQDTRDRIYQFWVDEGFVLPHEGFFLDDLIKHKLITSHDHNLYKITEFGRKAARLLENI